MTNEPSLYDSSAQKPLFISKNTKAFGKNEQRKDLLQEKLSTGTSWRFVKCSVFGTQTETTTDSKSWRRFLNYTIKNPTQFRTT